jgi:CelD/BcsL family acetyltransferase involved in cellulose biosynthesis
LPPKIALKLDAKMPDWRALWLDDARVQAVQQVVLAQFGWLMREHPELLPDPRTPCS